VELRELQEQMRRLYAERDRSRGTDATFRWLTEEVGELARALRKQDHAQLEHEFSDVLAWLASVANLLDVDLERAVTRYADGCPKCGQTPCGCAFER
jgi:NTP pyrophosphatase (non-canonical NTP hydrolase)